MFDDLANNNKNSAAVKPVAGQKKIENKNNVQDKSSFAATGNDLNKANPRNKRETAEDMFAETEPSPKPPVFEKKQENPNNNQRYDENNNSHQKIFFLVFAILILILLGVGGFWAYNRFIRGIIDESTTDKNIKTQEINEKINTEIKEKSPDDVVKDVINDTGEENMPLEKLDSDGDGLTDEEEWSLGTAIDSVDTDNDGLFDREEVKVYKTDPKNPDTDGDGHIDGDEVAGGYNPLGSGRLLEIKK
ncbi:hypothetical protein KAI65_00945 [Candidatus Parcubacteria bacterium]|nr:hypothetical protein [Candidatus Parcubacteria bacterium]